MTDAPAPEDHYPDEDQTREIVAAEPPQSTAVVLFGTDDPVGIVRRTTSIANALADAIKRQQMSTTIQGRDYVLAEGWAFLGAMFGVFPNVVSVTPVDCSEHQGCGFEARVELHSRDGSIVGGAIAECSSHEERWAQRDNHALKSMAQTRATGKAYRMSFGFVMKSAGYEATPAEEMAEAKPIEVRSTAAPAGSAPASQRREPKPPQPAEGERADLPTFQNVGALYMWALKKHDMSRDDVLKLLDCQDGRGVVVYGLDKAAQVIAEHQREPQQGEMV